MSEFAKDRLVAEAVARNAGKFIQRERLHGFTVSRKAVHDLVTSIDLASEKRIKSLLKAAYPEDNFLGEEFGASDQDALKKGRWWIIDPIDGTLNFSSGVPLYCVSIALQVDGQSVVGAVYEPNRDELFSAELGQGATLNGESISVSSQTEFSRAVLVTGFPPEKDGKVNNLRNFTNLCKTSRAVRRFGSAAIDLCYVAAGRMDAFWEFGLKPWDTSAGFLLVREAGGQVTTYDNAPYTGYQSSMIASNGAIHQDLLDSLTFDDCEDSH